MESLIKPLEDPLRSLLDFLHNSANLSYGWAIVTLTVMVRLVILPLFIQQYKSMRRMQVLAPQMKEIQRKYKTDKKRQQEEMMRFYRENNVNPLSSCLPILFQAPVFLALFYVLRNFAGSAKGGDLSFMWVVPDVSEQFRQIGWGAGVIAVIYGVSQLLATELSATPTMPDLQRKLFRLLPVAIVAGLFIWPVEIPAGLVIYWMTTNIWTAGQQLVLRRRLGSVAVVPVVSSDEEAASDPETKPEAKPARAQRQRAKQAANGEIPEPIEAPPPREAPEPTQTPAAAASQRTGSSSPRRRPPAKNRKGSNQSRRPPKKRR